jgi:16S rRNA (cytosine967-C5)-methyltransferase
VATSVDLAKDVVGMRPSGFVNAVLRRVGTRDLDGWVAIITPDRATDPVGYLAAAYSYPRWIVTAFADALGGDLAETEDTLRAGNARPQTTLVAIPGISDQAELTTASDGAAAAAPAPWSPYGAVLPGGDPGAIAAVAQGRAFVQDEASQLVALALAHAPAEPADQPSEPWLDLCAGPGGKAALLAGLADQADLGSHLIGSDLRPHRAGLTGEHLRRLPSAAAIAADGRVGAWRPGTFARVLADVPCSGLGALRRRPEARWRKSPEDVEGLVPLQRDLLNAAIDSARPGGVVGYVTCTPHQAETEGVVADVLAARDDVTVLDAPAILADALGRPVPGVSRGPGGQYVQLWPHRHGTDALFLALLRRS